MEEDDIVDVASTGSGAKERSTGNGRFARNRRPPGQNNRSWARISLGGLGSGRRREKEAKVFVTSRSSPRRMTLGAEGLGIGGPAYHGKHGIRYKQQTLATMVTEEMEEEMSEDFNPEKGSPGVKMAVLSASTSFGQLSGLEPGTIAEEGGSSEQDGEAEEDGVELNRSSHHGGSRTIDSREVDLCIDNEVASRASGSLRPVSPSSEARRASASPSQHSDNRLRTQSWAPDVASPVLSGPFSRARSRSRSPRHRFSMTFNTALDGLPSLQSEVRRLSLGGGEMTPTLSKDLSFGTMDEYLGWAGVSGGGEVEREGEEEVTVEEDGVDGDGETRVGAFTDSALLMARLRLPNMELGCEVNGFFGIDVRSLIIEREIARGAYGVVHEGVLLPHPPDEKDEEGERSGLSSNPEENSGSNTPSSADAKTDAKNHLRQDAGGEAGAVGSGEEGAAVAGEENAVGEGDEDATKQKEEGRKVAVKIQQVPEDEEEQANLIGELEVLKRYKHPHMVDFIGAAMAMERGADTVMVAMELCINGALREALKLSISWPLKIRIASDITDGLQYMHQHGIIHRDIKTPNVLIDGSWRAKLCDYNFAIDESSSIKQDFCAGTAEFMSPEVLLSEDYGLPSDIFSLGIIFVEMLTGREPTPDFPQRPPQAFFFVNEEEIQAEILPDCPASFSLLQSQCLFSEASDRPTAEDAHNWLQDLLNDTVEEEIAVPQKEPPLPVLTEGAAIAREGNVINTSPKGSEHNWHDSDAMEHQICSLVESAVDRAMAERGEHLGLSGLLAEREDQNASRLEEMKSEIETLRAACGERDTRIADLEVQALRNTSTLKMLSSALEVAYKMLEAQQATLCSGNFDVSSGGGGAVQPDGSAERNFLSGQETEDARQSRVASLAARV